MEDKLNIKAHIYKTVEKADKIMVIPTRFMPNIKGPGNTKKQVFGGVLQSILLYGTLIWGTTKIKKYNNKLIKIHENKTGCEWA